MEKDRMSMAEPTFPTLHLNGTARVELQRQLENALSALRTAIGAVQETEPHGRDYYPQGEEVYQRARDAHMRRIQVLRGVFDELFRLNDHVWNQGK